MTTLTGYSDARPLRTEDTPRSRWRAAAIALWCVQAATAVLFLFAGASKLAGAEAMVQTFDAIGLGQWFRYLTGGIEVVSAVLLLVPSLAFFGAIVLIPTMIGAVITHVFVVGGSPVPAGVLLLATAGIAWARRPR
jgi:putative oxidoreductase